MKTRLIPFFYFCFLVSLLFSIIGFALCFDSSSQNDTFGPLLLIVSLPLLFIFAFFLFMIHHQPRSEYQELTFASFDENQFSNGAAKA